MLSALSCGYKSVAALNLLWRGRHPRRHGPSWIVSIDNLSFGGTGKTSLILTLGEWLTGRAIPFAVVTRGYRSRLECTGGQVLPHHTAADVGDEALLLARRLPAATVLVGKDRHRSVMAALAAGRRVILLDDGMQTADLAKDRRIMLVEPRHPYYYLRHFPRLADREDGVLYHETPPACPPANYWGTYHFTVEGLFDSGGAAVRPPFPPLLAFSALGDNTRFRRSLGPYPVREFLAFADHH
ncbi:MAG TPA: tetraacyldisaccharide 4'-kinase, partial [Candidatus Aminicenantes bacterium]|nr:tetraacyldisaccharide 4'-kinase [Candidatus Aminicenantes bacterium]